jgi:DNA-directed RNA polymerase subunit RPC12/RpoP
MIRNPKRTCNDEEECKDIYGKNEPLHCEDHKLQDDICWLIKRCSNCGRDKELLNKDGGICCDKPFYEESKRLNKIKETVMIRYLRDNIKECEEILTDRIIDSICMYMIAELI